MKYVQTPQKGRGMPFRAALEGNARENLLLYRSSHSFVLMNRYPYNAGHLLALPQREVADLTDLDAEEGMDFWRTILFAERVLRKVMKPDGLNVGWNLGSAAGAGLPGHMHCHLVPRWHGDTNFMPVVGSVKVLPQALESLYDQLLSAFQKEMEANNLWRTGS
ncbi:MAG: HIT domain-containing protein [Puniceicoccales bacterium]|jgi:ATP adenylyltransferase|nr:HIT domain-containing protein [Puniceicoccales bacterium]